MINKTLRLPLLGGVIIILGCLLAYFIQTSNHIRVQDVRFTGTNGTEMSALLYVPKNATAKSPAPGILAVHGYFNSREAQDGFGIELSRRGYVVLAIDQTGHGHSQAPAFANAFGGIDGLKYLRSLDFVDKDNIGLEGHSMGGWTVLNAAAALPNGYKSIVLEGSSTGAPFAPEGTTNFPRNLAVVFSRYDEFSGLMWHVDKALNVAESKKLQDVFGTNKNVIQGQVYGSIDEGTGRILYTPGGTHPMDHINSVAIGHALDWFQKTLDGGTSRIESDQIWYWKEIGTLIALIGFVIFVMGVFSSLLSIPYFSSLQQTPPKAQASTRNTRWWITLLIGALIPAITFLPLTRLGGELIPVNGLFNQQFNNEISFWAVINALIILILAKIFGINFPKLFDKVTQSLALSIAVFALSYCVVSMADFFFKVDFRIWFLSFKVMSHHQLHAFFVYLIPLFIFFSITLRSMHSVLSIKEDSIVKQYFFNILALTFGFLIFLTIQYGLIFTGNLPIFFHIYDPLRLIISINFVPLMTFVAVVSTFAYRKTGHYLPGAIVCTLFVTWYVVVGQATQGG
ncbi:alpha/beta hydrolase [Marinomonas sp. CT5]|nr:alpha/beta fold hydrolase [Marinomonas sp. CT5]QUX96769.1 alpha/beta hydrolase [Marinomonas sp. CT5]